MGISCWFTVSGAILKVHRFQNHWSLWCMTFDMLGSIGPVGAWTSEIFHPGVNDVTILIAM